MAEWHRGGLGRWSCSLSVMVTATQLAVFVKLTALYTKTVNFTVCKLDLTAPDGQHQNQTDYILHNQRWRSSIQSAKTRLGADCGSDHVLVIAKYTLKLKKVGKTIRSFRYDLNQIPNDYTVEVRNIFKGPDLINKGPDEPWMEVHDTV